MSRFASSQALAIFMVFSTLVALMAIIPLSAKPLAAEDWVTIEAGQSSDLIGFQISGPGSWKQWGVASEFAASSTFTDGADGEFKLMRTLSGTAVIAGDYNGVDTKLADAPLDVLEKFATTIANNQFKNTSPSSIKLYDFNIITIAGLEALQIISSGIFNIDSEEIYKINDYIFIKYVQESHNKLFKANAMLSCDYIGYIDDKFAISEYFASEHDDVCQKFFNSFLVLNK